MTSKERKTSDIYITEDFKEILEIFQEKSEYAKLLLRKRLDKGLLKEDHINYFDVSKNDMSKISYLTQDRIGSINQSEEHDFWSTTRRYRVKPGSFLNKIFKDVPNKEVEKFATLWKTFAIEREFNFKIIEGKDIAKYYHWETNHRESGTLYNSCMKHGRCKNFFNIYIENNVKMLVMFYKETNEVMGRALLWETIDGRKIMDRIYTILDEEYLHHFSKWASDNGYIYKYYQNWSSTLQFNNNGEKEEHKLEIKLDNVEYEYYPYLDTFKWLDMTNKTISNFCKDPENDSQYRCLSSPSGSYERASFMRLDEISRNYCYAGDLVSVITSEGNELWTSSTHCAWSNIYDSYLLTSESEWMEEIEDYIYRDNSKNDIEKINNKIAILEEKRKPSSSRLSNIISSFDNGYLTTSHRRTPIVPRSEPITRIRIEEENPVERNDSYDILLNITPEVSPDCFIR